MEHPLKHKNSPDCVVISYNNLESYTIFFFCF